MAMFAKRLAPAVVAAAAAISASATATAVSTSAATVSASSASVSIAAARGHGGNWRRQIRAAFGVDDEVALLAFAVGDGFYVIHLAEGHVQQAPLAGVGGREAVGLAGLTNALGSGLGGELNLLQAERLEVEGVEADQIVLAGVEMEDLDGDVLEGPEELAVALGEQGGVGTGQLNVENLGTGILGVSGSSAGADAVLQP